MMKTEDRKTGKLEDKKSSKPAVIFNLLTSNFLYFVIFKSGIVFDI